MFALFLTIAVCFTSSPGKSVAEEKQTLGKTNRALQSALQAISEADCGSCAAQLVAAVGCEALLFCKRDPEGCEAKFSDVDINGKVPLGCDSCADEAVSHCKENPEAAVSQIYGFTLYPADQEQEPYNWNRDTYWTKKCTAAPAHWYQSCNDNDCIIGYKKCGGWLFFTGHELKCQKRWYIWSYEYLRYKCPQ